MNLSWAALKIFLADIGISAVLGFVVGAFLGAARVPVNEITEHPALVVFGLLVSIYVSYVLYRRYSQKIAALFALLAIAAVWMAINVYIAAVYTEGFNLQKNLLILTAQILSYSAGWYIAKTTEINLYIPKDGWIKAASILGGIMILVALLGVVSLVNA